MKTRQRISILWLLIMNILLFSAIIFTCMTNYIYGGDGMLHRDIATLDPNMKEIMYIDELTGETINGVVMKIEYINPNAAFVYVDENTKQEDGFMFKDIIVFDNRPNQENGWYKDTILANYR